MSPPDLQGASLQPVKDGGGQGLESWKTVATDGSAVLWSVITAPPGAPDSTGWADTYRSVRGEKGWEATYVSPPGATGGQSRPYPMFASPDVRRLLWETFNASIDPSDHDPAPATSPGQFSDLYRIDSSSVFTRMTRGSLEVPVAGESVIYVGASRDLERVVFADDRQLEPSAPSGGGLYLRDGLTTKLVSKDENGAPIGAYVLGTVNSSDGSIVAFPDPGQQILYVWSEQSGDTVKAVGPVLQGTIVVNSVSANGRKIVFSADDALTANDTDTSRDLYEYDSVTQSVTLLSAPSGGGVGGNSDACAASLPTVSRCGVAPVIATDDGSAVYFVSPEQIAPGQGVDGGVNLYLSTDGAIRFVATLDLADPLFNLPVRERHARMTSDGAKLVFESRAALTGYDNAGHLEVYLYDSVSGALTCASCRPSGTAPTGDSFLSLPGTGAAGVFGEPPITPANADERGDRVFFNSFDAIVPKDTNGRSDVYQYTVATRTPASISSGISDRDSSYIGNGADGRDVFFLTADALVPQDRNGSVYKMYDARVDGVVFPSPPEPPSCRGAACRPDEVAPQQAPQGTSRIVPRRRPPEPIAAPSRLLVSGSRSVKGTSLRLTAKVSGPGRLSVTGRGLVSSSRKTSRATSYHVTVRLSKTSAAKVRRAHRLTLSATVRFAPNKGTTRSVRVRLTFTAPSNRNAR